MNSMPGNVIIGTIRGYSSTQRLAFAAIAIGFSMCCVGCFSPYWKTGSISVDVPVLGLGLDVLKIRQGLWLFCVDVIGLGERCESTYNINKLFNSVLETLHLKDDSKEGMIALYSCSLLCLGLALISGLAACCRSCCCSSGGKTICHGVMTFLAGGFGILVVVVFATKGDQFLGISFVDGKEDYGWAFFLFLVGSLILIVSSFMLCCSSPRPNVYHAMPEPSAGSVVVQTSTVNQMSMMSAAPQPGPYPAMPQNVAQRQAPYSPTPYAEPFNKY